ncbi:hypothetical protein Plhal304r1_c051g0134581 [Plasmopara halstedii]
MGPRLRGLLCNNKLVIDLTVPVVTTHEPCCFRKHRRWPSSSRSPSRRFLSHSLSAMRSSKHKTKPWRQMSSTSEQCSQAFPVAVHPDVRRWVTLQAPKTEYPLEAVSVDHCRGDLRAGCEEVFSSSEMDCRWLRAPLC